MAKSVVRTPKKKSATKRTAKEHAKIEQQMIDYINDRLVVMQIETQSQPNTLVKVKEGTQGPQISLKQIDELKKLCSPNSSSMELMQNCVRPYPYIQNRVRRHVAKRPKKVYEYDKLPTKCALKRSRRNKRLRQTYFATSFGKNSGSGKEKCRKRAKLVDTTLDMYFPVKENSDIEMVEA